MRHEAETGAALFERVGDAFVPTSYAQGPWSPDTLFGGAPVALMTTLAQRMPTPGPMQLARITADLLRPVPMAPLTVRTEVIKTGKRVQLIDVSLLGDDAPVARASALFVRHAEHPLGDLPDGRQLLTLPTAARSVDRDFVGLPGTYGARRAKEYLFEATGGHYADPSWIRMRADVIAGEPTSRLAPVAFVADTAMGIGSGGGHRFKGWINSDVTVSFVREPVSEWLSVAGDGWFGQGLGQVQASISDVEGKVALVSMTRLRTID